MTDREYNEKFTTRLLDELLALAAFKATVDDRFTQPVFKWHPELLETGSAPWEKFTGMLGESNLFPASEVFLINNNNDCSDSEELDCFLQSIKINNSGGG